VFGMPSDMEMNFGVDVIGHRVLSKANGVPSGGMPAARRSGQSSRAVSPLKRAGWRIWARRFVTSPRRAGLS
jgi:hypothetical protein